MTDVVNNYKGAIKRQIVTSLKPIFGPNFPMAGFQNLPYIGLEYPKQALQFPAIYITFTEEELRNVGVGHFEKGIQEDGSPGIFLRWWFSGTLHFKVMALNPLDRDALASALVNVIAFGHTVDEFMPFYDRLYEDKYIGMTLLYERLLPEGDQDGEDVPWENNDEKIFSTTYGVKVEGEFVSNVGGGIITIETVEVYPTADTTYAPS